MSDLPVTASDHPCARRVAQLRADDARANRNGAIISVFAAAVLVALFLLSRELSAAMTAIGP